MRRKGSMQCIERCQSAVGQLGLEQHTLVVVFSVRKGRKFVALTESPMKIGGLLKNDSIKLEYRYRN